MPNNASNVISGIPLVTGGVYAAPIGTALPTSITTALNVGFVSRGYVTEDGLTKSDSRDSTEIRDWGGITVKRSQTGVSITFAFSFLEYLNAEAMKDIYGTGAVTVTAATVSTGTRIALAVNGSSSPVKSWIFEMGDGAAKVRIVIPRGQITETGDTTYSTADAAARPVTISAYPDASGNLYYEYTDDGVFA
jgi:hypothetical protein